MDGMEFEINFTDRTMLEANGEYVEAQEIMAKPQKVAGGIMAEVPSKEWVVKSHVTILHAIGFASVRCDFYHDGRVVIIDFKPSAKDIYIPDIRCLTAWAGQYGWQTPQPSPSTVDDWMDFWKMQWETYIVNSDYLDGKFGERSAIIFGKEDEDDDDEDLDKYRKKIH